MVPAARKTGLWLVVTTLLAAGSAVAQTAGGAGTPSVPISNTNGIKIGEGRLHGFFEYEARFDSAAGFFNATGTPRLSPEFINHFRPGLRFDIPLNWFDLALNGYVDYVWYTGAITPGSQIASRLEANADLEMGFNRGGVVEVDVGDLVARSDRTRTTSVGVGVLSLYNEVHVAVPIRPGGGALEFTPRGSYAVEFFQSLSGIASPGCSDVSCDPKTVGSLNYQNIQAALQAKWRFFPKTAVFIDTSYDARSYFSAGAGPRASMFRITGGLAGLLTAKLQVTAKIGWGQDFGSSGGSSVLAQAEVAYFFSETASLRGGYVRTLEPVAIYGSYRDDRAYIEGRALFGGIFTLRLYGAYDWLEFFNGSNRQDQAVMVDIGPQVQVMPWFLVGVGYVFTRRTSNTSTAESFNFNRHEAYVRLTLTY